MTASQVADIVLRQDLGVVAMLSPALGLLYLCCIPVAERSPNWNGAPELTSQRRSAAAGRVWSQRRCRVQERPNRKSFPRKRDVRPKLSSAKASPPAFQSATAHPQARSGLKAKGAPLFNSGPFLLSPLGRVSLIRRFPARLLPPLRGKFIAFHRGIPLSSTFKNPQGFGAISPATPFPEVLLRTQSGDLSRHCNIDELV